MDEGQSLKAIQEAMQTLASASGHKALVRRFGDILHRQFGVRRLSLAGFSHRQKKLVLQRCGVRFGADLQPYEDSELENLAHALTAANFPLSELKEGLTRFRAGEQMVTMATIEDPEATGSNPSRSSLLIWESPASVSPHDETLMELLVRHLQSESRWYRRLDKTQAMLYRDDLTGLFNYRYFEIALDQELARASRFQSQFCLLFIDMDGFKPVNDQHGHMAGSSILKQVADVIRDAVREIDVPIRYGGDEFVVVLLGATCAKGLLAAERVRRRIEQREFVVDGGSIVRLTASIGVASYPEHAKERELLLKLADETMYNSKRGGKNRVTIVGQATTTASVAALASE